MVPRLAWIHQLSRRATGVNEFALTSAPILPRVPRGAFPGMEIDAFMCYISQKTECVIIHISLFFVASVKKCFQFQNACLSSWMFHQTSVPSDLESFLPNLFNQSTTMPVSRKETPPSRPPNLGRWRCGSALRSHRSCPPLRYHAVFGFLVYMVPDEEDLSC